jgi:hypothetical protein
MDVNKIGKARTIACCTGFLNVIPSASVTLAAKRGLLENQRRLEKKRIARRQWDMLMEK